MVSVPIDNSQRSLRERAEALLSQAEEEGLDLAPNEIVRLVHDLSVYQIELELQNENLRSMQNQLEDSRDRYARLYHQAPVGYLSLDRRGMVQYVNQTFARLVGWEGTDLIGQALADFMAGSDRETFLSRFRAFFNDPAGKSMDAFFRGRNGHAFQARLTGRHDPDSALLSSLQPRLLVVVHDISEQQALEDALRESQVFLQGILDSVSSHIAVLDHHGVIVAVNEAWRRFARENHSELGQRVPNTEVGANYLDICRSSATITTETSVEARDAYAGIQAVLEGRLLTFSLEYPCHSPDEQRWFLMTVTPLGKNSKSAVVVHTNITERKQTEEKIRDLAYYDSLTGLPNRRLLQDRLDVGLAASRRLGQHGALMLLDLDNFKPLNDEQGHAVGDLLLIEVARRLTGSVRELDTVARLGGDEFVILLGGLNADPATARVQAMTVAEKIRNALSEPYRLSIGHDDESTEWIGHHCSSSIGVVLFLGRETAGQKLLKQADAAMYQAKAAGRNTIQMFEVTG